MDSSLHVSIGGVTYELDVSNTTAEELYDSIYKGTAGSWLRTVDGRLVRTDAIVAMRVLNLFPESAPEQTKMQQKRDRDERAAEDEAVEL